MTASSFCDWSSLTDQQRAMLPSQDKTWSMIDDLSSSLSLYCFLLLQALYADSGKYLSLV